MSKSKRKPHPQQSRPAAGPNNKIQAQADALAYQGFTLLQQGDFARAQAIFLQVLELHPSNYNALQLLGMIAGKTHNYPAAADYLTRALKVNPKASEVHSNLGNVFDALGRHEQALHHYNQALAVNPRHADALYNRGSVLRKLKRYAEAVVSYDRAFAVNPNHSELRGMRQFTKQWVADWSNFDQDVQAMMEGITRMEPGSSPFVTLGLTDSAALQRQSAWIRVMGEFQPSEALGPLPRDPARLQAQAQGSEKIRVAYFSADFHDHATTHLMLEVLERHDRERFSWIAFSFGPDSEDPMRQRVLAAMDEFIDVRMHSDIQVAHLARQKQIDIAVDLKGFTSQGRVGIFAHRAAPIQISYLGYPGTMAAPYYDYLVADAVVVPQASRVHYSEKIISMPHSYQCNTRRPVAERFFTRAELGLPEAGQGVVFACFNNNYKILPATFAGWMRILQAVPNSVLWLLEDNEHIAQRLCQAAQNLGLDPERLVFAPRLPTPEHLARQAHADLFLDTFPYNAHTTASDALWVGLPVLTRAGEAFASRVAASLLTALGVPELICSDQASFEARAIALAQDLPQLQSLRQRILHNRDTAPLYNSSQFALDLERGYLRAFERHQQGLAPEHIEIA